MCFSATASLGAAALTGAAGSASLSRVAAVREFPLAAIPLIFSAQQLIEGLLWIALPRGGGYALATAFAAIALVIWPVWVPMAVGLVERNASSRYVILALIPPGLAVAIYGALTMLSHPYGAVIVNSRICYVSIAPYSKLALGLYLVCTCAPALLSTYGMLRKVGMMVVVGLSVAALFYFNAFFSVWCFFAAIISSMIYVFFRHRVYSTKIAVTPVSRFH